MFDHSRRNVLLKFRILVIRESITMEHVRMKRFLDLGHNSIVLQRHVSAVTRDSKKKQMEEKDTTSDKNTTKYNNYWNFCNYRNSRRS